MKLKYPVLIACSLLASQSYAGGIRLHEMATFDSVSSAGAANATQNRDASAVISNPAGLSQIEDFSYSAGLMGITGGWEFNGERTGIDSPVSVNSKASADSLAPSFAYALRMSDRWVLGAAVYGEGGLGLDYSNGMSGLGLSDDVTSQIVQINFAGAYQVNDKLSLGAALILQSSMIDGAVLGRTGNSLKLEGYDTNLGAKLSVNYQLSDNTVLAANYQPQTRHDPSTELANGNINQDLNMKVTWPSTLDLGFSHRLNSSVSISGQLSYEQWSQYGDASGKDYDDVFGIALSADWCRGRYRYQAGIRYDTQMMAAQEMTPDLAIGNEWAIGFGAERILNSGHRVGLAYEYRQFDTEPMSFGMVDNNVVYGEYEYNRLHFISLSLAY